MSNTISLNQVEGLALQLPPSDQLKLVAHISEQLGDRMPASGLNDAPDARREREAQAEALLAELDAIAESIEGQSNSAEDIRRLRTERASRL